MWGRPSSIPTRSEAKMLARLPLRALARPLAPRMCSASGGSGSDDQAAGPARPADPEKQARKEAKKAMKAEKRARREGKGDPDYGRKPCDLCQGLKDLLIRCQTDDTGAWRMVCGKCWNEVSGGVVDGDDKHPDYRYGGLWKNLHRQ